MSKNIIKKNVQPKKAKMIVKGKAAVKDTAPLKAPILKPVLKNPVIQAPIINKPAMTKPVKEASSEKPLPIQSTAPKPAAVKADIKKKKIDDPDSDSYFVYLRNPLEYRRHLLESCRKILFCLKCDQKITLIRQKKLEEMRKLRISVKELIYLNKKFNEKLPKYNTGFLEETPSKDKGVLPKKVKTVEVKRPMEPKSEPTEMDRLEESLANIERKLKTLQ